MSRPKLDPVARFWSKVNKNGPVPERTPELGPCWVWTGWTIESGYGYFSLNGKSVRAHRAVLTIEGNPPEPRDVVCHKCDNPGCVRPSHLFIGTHGDNMADRQRKGRTANGDRSGARTHPESNVRGEQQWLAKLTEAGVLEIFSLRSSGASKAEIARRFGVTHGCVRSVLNRDTWRHVTPPVQTEITQ